MHTCLFRRLFVGLALFAILTGSFYTVYSARAAARPYLGVRLEAVATEDGEAGLTVADVNPGGPADQAGLKKGDRIIMARGKPMRTYIDLRTLLADCTPGDALDLILLRNGTERTARINLGQMPARPVVAAQAPSAYLGVLSEALTAEERQQLGLNAEQGVVIVHVLPGSPAATAGLLRNDVITKVGTSVVGTQDELRNAIHQAGADTEVVLKVVRTGQQMDIKARPQPMPAAMDLPQVLPEWHNGRGKLMGPMPLEGLKRLPALEQRVRELEKRVHELERKLPK
jgi:S1-C subfamily serine protease